MKSIAFVILVLGLAVSNAASYAELGNVLSQNNGAIVSGTYLNTPGSRTTFVNSGGGLSLHSGDLVRGLENTGSGSSSANSCGTPVPISTSGGTLYFQAPGSIVRLDGSIDVSAIRTAQSYTANGGKVFVDSSYLYQNGQIYANGANGAGSTPVAGAVIGVENNLLNRSNLSVGNSVEAQGGVFRIINTGN